MTQASARPRESLRRHVYVALEGGHVGSPASVIVEATLIVLIVANVLAYSLQSVPSFEKAHWRDLIAFEIVSVAIFTVEYLLRLWTAPEDPLVAEYGSWRGRLHFATRPMLLIDLFAIAPAYVALFVPFVDLRLLRLVRLLRLLKIARYSPAMSTLMHVIVAERRALFGTLLLLLCAVVFAGAALHAAEGGAQPNAFGTIPDAMWWAIATLTTVGYGDVVPVTVLGRILAGITMIFGLGLFALPVGIIATGFVNEIHRRDFVVTFSMLARVPLFKEFDARILGEMMTLLRAQVVPAGGFISVGGEPATAMYFIISGDVEARLSPDAKVRFGPGDFFGELALLEDRMRHATVTAISQCRLLALSTEDFNKLIGKHPILRQRIEEIGRERLKQAAGGSDIATAEIAAAGTARAETGDQI